MKKLFLLLIFTAFTQSANAFDIKCKIGSTRCIKTQGTEITADNAITLSDYCDDFTRNDIGRATLHMSIQRILEISGKNINHPVYSAYYAFDKLYDSPLKFDRKSNVEDTNYLQIKQSCMQLNRDFYNDSKWTK